MRNLFLLLLIYALCLTSCQQSIEEQLISNELQVEELPSLDRFSLLLSKALFYEPDFRAFIKKEALKMFDNDYDVFYPIVKNEIVIDNKSFRDILKLYDSDNELSILEQMYPLLTIFVPHLPSGFNAETWDCATEIPFVTSRLGKNKNTYFQNGTQQMELDAKLIPGFPVLVVKNNERVVRNTSHTRATGELSLNSDYSFADEIFDNINHPKTRSSIPNIEGDIEYLRTAYQEMGSGPNYWQRDNIYYGLTLKNTEGPLNRNFVENIRAIKFSEQAFSVMNDQQGYDPILDTEHGCAKLGKKNNHKIDPASMWQDGQFEFKIDITINNQSGLGANITKPFVANPTDLYDLDYTEENSKHGLMYLHIYRVNGVIPKFYYPNINLVTWDLENNSFSWKFTVWEIDRQATYTVQEKYASEFAANFSVSSSGDSKKTGLNFGVSAKKTKECTFTRVIYEESDELGTLEAHFSDPIMLSNSSNSSFDAYSIKNPMVEIVLCPIKLY